ncbi:MAG: nuclear transport factor 2 family protein [Acidobacteriia bacterium]|nr:nuclear transport factor 2 family protein [Terriglobia bacterium]
MMRRFLMVALVAVAFLGVARWTVKNAAAADDLKAELMKAEDARNEALPKGDVAALEKLYADDVVYTNARGETLSKTAHLTEIKGRKLAFQSFKHDDVSFHIYGTTGIVTGVSRSVVVNNGVVSNTPRKFVNVYSKVDGKWLCVGHTETPMVQ